MSLRRRRFCSGNDGRGGGEDFMAGGAGAVEMMKNTSLSRGELHLTNQAEMSKIAKRELCKLFC